MGNLITKESQSQFGAINNYSAPHSNFLFDPEIEPLMQQKIPFYIESLSHHSRSAFRSDMGIYINWCKKNEFCAVPIHPLALRTFLFEQSQEVCPTTLERRLSTITKLHTLLDLKSPRLEPEIVSAMKAIKTKSEHRIRQAQPLRHHHLTILPSLIDKDNIRDIRDISLTFVAHSTLLRRGELSDIKIKDIEFDEGSGTGIITVRNIKGQKATFDEHHAFLTPMAVYWLKRWLSMSGLKEGKVYRPISKAGRVLQRSMNPKYIAESINRMGRMIDPDFHFTGHSTRVGAAQDMIANNIETTKAMNAGRWKDHKTFLRYVSKLNANENGMAELARKLGS